MKIENQGAQYWAALWPTPFDLARPSGPGNIAGPTGYVSSNGMTYTNVVSVPIEEHNIHMHTSPRIP
jgi:hypothetical protein